MQEEEEEEEEEDKTSKAREEGQDVVWRANSSQRRAPSLCGFFTASSRPDRIAHHISTAGKTSTAPVSTPGERNQNILQSAATETRGTLTRVT
ncbi:hypothetical protein PBY51_011424 [Eleginops maclovinus]|uniref:Uncharacterized protein n=1 Tax=Eleginops maclovinus TaxID=56733 RepID=A0AAN7XU47_ELEMC|nr:hypothetical protein PBY51_011424 [Eleginops maclovinus]